MGSSRQFSHTSFSPMACRQGCGSADGALVCPASSPQLEMTLNPLSRPSCRAIFAAASRHLAGIGGVAPVDLGNRGYVVLRNHKDVHRRLGFMSRKA